MPENGTLKKTVSRKAGLPLMLITIFVLIVVVFMGVVVILGVFREPVPRTPVEKEILFWKEKVSRNSDDALNHKNLALAYLSAGQAELAEDEFEIALKLNKNFYDANLGLALVFQKEKKFDLAIKELKRVLRKRPDHSEANFQLGRIYYRQKKYNLAQEAFQTVLKTEFENADAHYYLGLTYQKTKDDSLAAKEFEEALKYFPGHKAAKDALERSRK